LFVLAAAWAAAARGEWKVIAHVSATAPGMSYDAARTGYEPPYLTTWTRVVLSKPAILSTGIEYRSALQKLAIDCVSKSWAVVRSEFYDTGDASGAAAYSYSVERKEWELRPARAGSNAALLLRVLCSTPKPW